MASVSLRARDGTLIRERAVVVPSRCTRCGRTVWIFGGKIMSHTRAARTAAFAGSTRKGGSLSHK
jgi:hypothetical protein